MQVATFILNKHTDINDGAPLHLLEVRIQQKPGQERSLTVKIADWVKEIINHFEDQYGKEAGHKVASKVITRFLLQEETIH